MSPFPSFFSFILCLFFFLLVAVTVPLLAGRSRWPKRGDGSRTSGDALLEAAWTAIPLLLVAFLLIWGLQAGFKIDQTPLPHPREENLQYPFLLDDVDGQNA